MNTAMQMAVAIMRIILRNGTVILISDNAVCALEDDKDRTCKLTLSEEDEDNIDDNDPNENSLVPLKNITDDDATEDDKDGMPWRSLHQSLRSLQLKQLPKLVTLARGMQHLTCLQNLNIEECENLIALPEWISCLSSLQTLTIISCNALESLPEAISALTSLQQLEITNCTILMVRCHKPNGEDWPKIQHIPSVSVREWGFLDHYFRNGPTR